MISAALWLHIIFMIATSLFFFPAIFILKRRNPSWLVISKVATIITIVLGSATAHFQQPAFHSSSHSALGYFILLLLVIFLSIDVWRSKPSTVSKLSNKALDIFQRITSILLPLLIYVEIVLGVINLLGFCSSPYTQQCFGHLGIGSLYLLYFSFWAVLVIDNGRFSQMGLQSEIVDAVLLVPCGLGLSLFGHAWGYPWDDESVQHVFLGIFTLIAVVLGTWLSTDSNGRYRRNIFPGLVSLVVAYTFLSHPAKSNHVLSSLHQALGFLSAGIGICRVLDVVFVTYLTPEARSFTDGSNDNGKRPTVIGLKGPWNALASFLGITVGIVTMVANDEQAELLEEWGLRAPSVFMMVLAMGMGVMGYVSIIAVLSSGGRIREMGRNERIEMEDS